MNVQNFNSKSQSTSQTSQQEVYGRVTEISTYPVPKPMNIHRENYQAPARDVRHTAIDLDTSNRYRKFSEDTLSLRSAKSPWHNDKVNSRSVRSENAIGVVDRARMKRTANVRHFIRDPLSDLDLNFSTLDPFFRLPAKLTRREQGLIHFCRLPVSVNVI